MDHTNETAPPSFEAGAVVAERFRLERELGRGGMGAVWLAHHIALDIPCAVKFISEARLRDAAGCARFAQEARAAAKLRSPNVVQILDHGIWESVPYIAMELLEGETLAERLTREGKLTPTATARIIGEMAQALAVAEELKIVHRDLKPDNVFIVTQGGREIVKILDFGIAKHNPSDGSAAALTLSGALIGTPHYMSPEQAHGGKKIDHRSDLWALGVIAFECVTGRPPFEGTGLGELMSAILTAPIPVPSHIEPSLPPGFDQWWERASARDPDARFQSASECAEALDGVVSATALGATMPASARTISSAVISAPRQVPASTFDGSVRSVEPQRWPRVALAVLALGLAVFAGAFFSMRWTTGTVSAERSAQADGPLRAPEPRASDAAASATVTTPAPSTSATEHRLPKAAPPPLKLPKKPPPKPVSTSMLPGY